MKINIDKLTEAELIDLNRRIVERIRFLGQMRAHSQILEFRLVEKVKFHPSDRPTVTGVLTRYDKKTVTVISDDGLQWNVSPGLLSAADGPEDRAAHTHQVIQIK